MAPASAADARDAHGPLPPLFFGVLVVITVVYLGLVQILKRHLRIE